MKKFRIVIAVIFVLNFLLIPKIKSQNFNYSVLVQNSSFVFLTDSLKTTIDSSVWDDNAYQIPIGFNFEFAGSSFDSLTIHTNGTITFNNNSTYNFVALFKNFISDANSDNHSLSPIAKELITLSDGTKQLKIEFKNATFKTSAGVNVHLSFQIWLNQQSNSIEFHMGTIDIGITGENCMLGMLNMKNDGAVYRGYLLQGNPSTPTGDLIPVGGQNVQLSNVPPSGTVYKFTIN